MTDPDSQRWEDGAYNGFTLRQRYALAFAPAWIKRGELPTPAVCQACGQKAGRIIAHGEDYAQPTGYFELCHPCHMALHARFKRPALFERWRNALHAGWRPVPMTYPDRATFRRLYQAQPSGYSDWLGSWGTERGAPSLFDVVSTVYVPAVPAPVQDLVAAIVATRPPVSTLSPGVGIHFRSH